MLPIYPLDGGQILQSLLWFVFGYARSLMIAASLGLVGVAALILFAIMRTGLVAGIYVRAGGFVLLERIAAGAGVVASGGGAETPGAGVPGLRGSAAGRAVLAVRAMRPGL